MSDKPPSAIDLPAAQHLHTQRIHTQRQASFSPGQIIHHQLFGYRGVIYDVDAVFMGTEEWYEKVAKSRPPKDEPWYLVLPDESDQTTYVAEQNLEPDLSAAAIEHPLLDQYFQGFADGAYVSNHSLH